MLLIYQFVMFLRKPFLLFLSRKTLVLVKYFISSPPPPKQPSNSSRRHCTAPRLQINGPLLHTSKHFIKSDQQHCKHPSHFMTMIKYYYQRIKLQEKDACNTTYHQIIQFALLYFTYHFQNNYRLNI